MSKYHSYNIIAVQAHVKRIIKSISYDVFSTPPRWKRQAPAASDQQLRHLCGEFAEHFVDRFFELLRVLVRIVAEGVVRHAAPDQMV